MDPRIICPFYKLSSISAALACYFAVVVKSFHNFVTFLFEFQHQDNSFCVVVKILFGCCIMVRGALFWCVPVQVQACIAHVWLLLYSKTKAKLSYMSIVLRTKVDCQFSEISEQTNQQISKTIKNYISFF